MSRGLMILCLVTLSAAPVAHAQGTPAEREQALAIAAEAEQAYNLSNFEEALALYERAYGVYPAPQLQFNLGQCHRELGHHQRAIFLLERYLDALPDAPNRVTVRELIAEQEEAQRLEAERLEEAQRIEMTRQQEDLAQADRVATEEGGNEVYEEWWFWTLIVAVVAAGISVPVGVMIWQTPVLPGASLGTVDLRP